MIISKAWFIAPCNISRALVGMGAAGVFAPINSKQWMHAPVFKRVEEFLSDTMIEKGLIQKAKVDAQYTHYN